MKFLLVATILATLLSFTASRGGRYLPGGRCLPLCREETSRYGTTPDLRWITTPGRTCTTIDDQQPRVLTMQMSLIHDRHTCRWNYRCTKKIRLQGPDRRTILTHPPSRRKRATHHITANSFLFMSYVYAKKVNVSSCWVCTHVPTHAHGGVPLVPVPFSLEQTAEWVIYQNRTVSNHLALPTRFSQSSSVNHRKAAQDWQSAGYQLRAFTGWRQPPYSSDHTPPFFHIQNPQTGSVCLLREVKTPGTHVLGSSSCNYTLGFSNWKGFALINNIANHTGGPDWTQIWTSSMVTSLTPYNGTYFICGHKAYPWLPTNWAGSCYLGFVVPGITHYPQLGHQPLHRAQRSIPPWEVVTSLFWPQMGAIWSLKKYELLCDILEQVANDTAEGLSELSAELVAIRTVALQNHMALDYLLAKEGGTCAVIGTECCTYIPDSSENITQLVTHIRDGVQRLRPTSNDDWWNWMWSSSWATYLSHGLIIFIALCL
ncbi:uncharacterized protein LOC119963608 [Scyliorhinus canicula]|uniref:uncharacterized protein LOC119963608 n=1 Tax=Scyliorhinus canicula TaxID=7830 RepID=UPI0018F3A499|nr:uncharacterized protein LOC119963608 [Scyliorhinus canicula]